MLATTGMATEAAAVLLEISDIRVVKAANRSTVTNPPSSENAESISTTRFTAPVWMISFPKAMPLANKKYMPHMAWLSAYSQRNMTLPFSS